MDDFETQAMLAYQELEESSGIDASPTASAVADRAVVPASGVMLAVKSHTSIHDINRNERRRKFDELRNLSAEEFEARMNGYATISLGSMYGLKNVMVNLDDVKKIRLSLHPMNSFPVNNTSVTDVILAPNRNALLLLGPMSVRGVLHNKSFSPLQMDGGSDSSARNGTGGGVGGGNISAFLGGDTLRSDLPLMTQLKDNDRATTYVFCAHEMNVDMSDETRFSFGYKTMIEIFTYLVERAEEKFRDDRNRLIKLRELKMKLNDKYQIGFKMGNCKDMERMSFSKVDADLIANQISADDLWPASEHRCLLLLQFPLLRFSMSGASFHCKIKHFVKIDEQFERSKPTCFDFSTGMPIVEGSRELLPIEMASYGDDDCESPMKRSKKD